jgi:hypothetical protein
MMPERSRKKRVAGVVEFWSAGEGWGKAWDSGLDTIPKARGTVLF